MAAHGAILLNIHAALRHWQLNLLWALNHLSALAHAAGQTHLTDRPAHHLRGPPPQLVCPPVRKLRKQSFIFILRLEPPKQGVQDGCSQVYLRSCRVDVGQIDETSRVPRTNV